MNFLPHLPISFYFKTSQCNLHEAINTMSVKKYNNTAPHSAVLHFGSFGLSVYASRILTVMRHRLIARPAQVQHRSAKLVGLAVKYFKDKPRTIRIQVADYLVMLMYTNLQGPWSYTQKMSILSVDL